MPLFKINVNCQTAMMLDSVFCVLYPVLMTTPLQAQQAAVRESTGTASATKSDDDVKTPDSKATNSNSDSENQAEEAAEPEYVRIRKNDRRLAVALETSVVTMADSKQFPGSTVDLIGAIHLGETEYYEQLNNLFRKYDVVLYEAVMPEEAVRRDLRPGGGSGSNRKSLTEEEEWTEAKIGLTAISVLQLGMKDALGLDFQLSAVNYAMDNFVHADMTAEEFEATMARRGESFSQMLAREMAKAMAKQNEQNPLAMNLDMMLSALSSDRVYRIRRIAAVQLAKAGGGDAFAAADGSSTIITERNIKALDILKRELKKGHKKVGVFYGAGHLADMETRMIDEFGFHRTAESWLTAWHLREEATADK